MGSKVSMIFFERANFRHGWYFKFVTMCVGVRVHVYVCACQMTLSGGYLILLYATYGLCRTGGQLFPLCLCFSVSIYVMVLCMGQVSWERCVVCSVCGLFEDLKSGNCVCSALRRHFTHLFGVGRKSVFMFQLWFKGLAKPSTFGFGFS